MPMEYKDFLFCSLLRAYNKSFDALPYDDMFEQYRPIQTEFNSYVMLNYKESSEYDQIVEFFLSIDIKSRIFN